MACRRRSPCRCVTSAHRHPFTALRGNPKVYFPVSRLHVGAFHDTMGALGAVWGFLGVNALIGYAIFRLTPRAWEALQSDLSLFQWIVVALWLGFMLVAEGYRGFQKKFSPRTAARVRYLSSHPTWQRVLLAPPFCMGYFHADRKTRIVSISLTLGIICLVILVSFAPHPWRGIIDVGVVAGLVWGLATFWWFTWKAFTDPGFAHSPHTPNSPG